MMKYILVEAYYPNDGYQETIEYKVGEKIKQGWHPLGGISVTVDGDFRRFYQAMVSLTDEQASAKIDLDDEDFD